MNLLLSQLNIVYMRKSEDGPAVQSVDYNRYEDEANEDLLFSQLNV